NDKNDKNDKNDNDDNNDSEWYNGSTTLMEFSPQKRRKVLKCLQEMLSTTPTLVQRRLIGPFFFKRMLLNVTNKPHVHDTIFGTVEPAQGQVQGQEQGQGQKQSESSPNHYPLPIPFRVDADKGDLSIDWNHVKTDLFTQFDNRVTNKNEDTIDKSTFEDKNSSQQQTEKEKQAVITRVDDNMARTETLDINNNPHEEEEEEKGIAKHNISKRNNNNKKQLYAIPIPADSDVMAQLSCRRTIYRTNSRQLEDQTRLKETSAIKHRIEFDNCGHSESKVFLFLLSIVVVVVNLNMADRNGGHSAVSEFNSLSVSTPQKNPSGSNKRSRRKSSKGSRKRKLSILSPMEDYRRNTLKRQRLLSPSPSQTMLCLQSRHIYPPYATCAQRTETDVLKNGKIETLSIVELRRELTRRGFSNVGEKQTLIDRLHCAIQHHLTQTQTESKTKLGVETNTNASTSSTHINAHNSTHNEHATQDSTIPLALHVDSKHEGDLSSLTTCDLKSNKFKRVIPKKGKHKIASTGNPKMMVVKIKKPLVTNSAYHPSSSKSSSDQHEQSLSNFVQPDNHLHSDHPHYNRVTPLDIDPLTRTQQII
ncbi:hypothetical protein RFI_23331, partial [Reticulomyxa filosa]